MSGQRIGTQELADHLGQAVEAFAKVGVPRAQEDANGKRQAQHDGPSSKTARRRRNVSASKSVGTRITRPAPATTSSAGAAVAGATRSGTKAGMSARSSR